MAGLTVHTSGCGEHAVVAFSGELDMTGAACASAAVKGAGHHVIVDLSALEYMDCHALGALLRARELARLAGGDVLLAAPRGIVLRVLCLSGVTGLPGIFASVRAAAAGTGRCAIPRTAAGPDPIPARPYLLPRPGLVSSRRPWRSCDQ